MEYVECPVCANAARRMPVLSHINRTDDFYQCDTCSRVSHMPKDASAPPVLFSVAPAAAPAPADRGAAARAEAASG